MYNHNILTKDDCVFLVDILTKYTNQNKLDYFLNEDKFNEIYNKLNIIANGN